MYVKVIKFGGSSLTNDEDLKKIAQKIIGFTSDGYKIVAILSAQGKTTDRLLSEAKTLSSEPDKRELDMLISVGEQISIAKLSILLNGLNTKTISLTGWQAGITTDDNYTEAKIKDIYSSRIWRELENNNVVLIAGFQGINSNNDITTLGRDGSDTTAVSIAAALEQQECYIFTDTDGIYDKDPHKYKKAKKIECISYDEMERLAENGAKVLHKRCIKIAKKYGIKIMVNSSFRENKGSIVG